MIFTLYYMYATLLQWWRIGVTKKKLSKAISNQSSIVIYQKDRQINHSNIEDVIFLQGDKVGCTIVPRKKVSIDNWLPFSTKNFFPFSKKRYTKIDVPNFTVLIQADMKNFNNGFDYDKLQLTELGVPMAWTASDSFGIVLRTDLDNFSKLVSCFLSNSIAINEGMEVLQVEVIDVEGEPKRLDDKLIQKIKWPKIITSNKQWKHLIDDLKHICKKVNHICSAQNGNVHKEISPERISHGSKHSLEVDPKYGSKTLLTVSKKSENHHDHKHKSRIEKDSEKHKHGSEKHERDKYESRREKYESERDKYMSERDKYVSERDKHVSERHKKDRHESEGEKSRDRPESEGDKPGKENKIEKYTIEIPENIRYKEKRKSIMELVQHPDIQITEETKLEPLICKIQDQVEKKIEKAKLGDARRAEEKHLNKKDDKQKKTEEKSIGKVETEDKCNGKLLEKSEETKSKSTGTAKAKGTETSKSKGLKSTETSKLTDTLPLKVIGTEVSKVTGTEVSKVTGTEVSKVTGTEVSKVTGTEVLKVTGTEVSKIKGTESPKVTGIGEERSEGFMGKIEVIKKSEGNAEEKFLEKPEAKLVEKVVKDIIKVEGNVSEKIEQKFLEKRVDNLGGERNKKPSSSKSDRNSTHKFDKKSEKESKRFDEASSSKTVKDSKVERHKKLHKKSDKGSPEKTASVESTTESDSLESDKKKYQKPESDVKSDKSKNKRTNELTQEHKIKQSSSMDKIKKDTDKHKKESHKTKREKFAKRYSDDRLLNKDVEIDKDISKPTEKNLRTDEVVTNKKRFTKAKPPNVLVCADSLQTRENVKTILKNILNNNKYIVYELPVAGDPYFGENSTLVIVCGNVSPNLKHQLLTFFLNGGNLLCLCSDFINSVLPTFTTAEVREHELVRFSYGEWKRVRMMHHIFCYQASPAKKHFSQDSSDQNSSNHSSGNSPVAPRTPPNVELHHNNKNYMVQVQVLGQEETWHTPSILLAKVKNGTGKAVFSQVHLEVDPTQYEDDETKFITLKDSDNIRLAIIKDILSNHLSMDCMNPESNTVEYKLAYFLGRHDLKQELLFKMPNLKDNILRLPNLTLQFCGRDIIPPAASEKLMPILIHGCPERFSTVQYFENLKSDIFGRLVIYSDVMSSSMDVVTGAKLKHGIVVIPCEQTTGKGRGGNVWLSPKGAAMFTIQLHVPMDSPLGRSLPLIQIMVAVAVVSAIRSLPGYESLSIGLKWPNDVYAYSSVKVGGLIVNSMVESTVAICNIGCGINLNNAEPTSCINSIIRKHNEENGTKLKEISFEKFFAMTFTESERIYNIIQQDNLNYLYELYYKYWLHSDSIVSVQTSENMIKDVSITGIDNYGYLVVRAKDGTISSVQPDNNTFDIMQGLIAPKIR